MQLAGVELQVGKREFGVLGRGRSPTSSSEALGVGGRCLKVLLKMQPLELGLLDLANKKQDAQ